MLVSTIQEYQQRVDDQLKQRFSTLEDTALQLKAAMTYGALLGGKRIRPFLVYSVGRMFGVELEKLDACAAAIECIHAYSLIHDDLPAMDDDELRRGQPTVHIAFDEATAILAGDALQTLAFEIVTETVPGISSEQHIAMVRVLAKASGYRGMCGGQAIDLASTDKHIDLNALTQLHNMKTGALISCAVELALIAANAPKDQYAAMMDFARAVGLAFQVQDDILDIVATTEELGKPQGSDTESNKSTFPQLLGLQGAQDTAKQLIQEALSALAKLPYNSQLIADFARYIIERRI
ncbi:MAG: (2E,6E)-farnesyl diphosphate synthase [Shewanella sp.]|uniref:(2E,6E)-farnesyl diphosphate synthase n=1 Tax=unclassified Shewanella TaxID=196818 RepID=UPI0021D9B791|nr:MULTISPECIES: (2E,6E)-farnesyl diphosphate synthase [unclassified Shewanella]MCU8032817.1 (2E,6E)-farnesyl diphosphate synthase [Shewanella sp. SM71]MCU8094703.1 (2E,6E)-farnesyl diphosphate synthase [Shewanella sp. SM102]